MMAKVKRSERRLNRLLSKVVLAAVACVILAGTYAIGTSGAARSSVGRPVADVARRPAAASSSAAEFARDLVGLTKAYATEHGDPTRLADVDCVRASAGHYMCSYAAVRPDGARECHLMQARWTPQLASSFTVTLAGRTRKCGTLREAIRSLR